MRQVDVIDEHAADSRTQEKKSLEETGKPQLKGRAGKLINLIGARDIAHLYGQSIQDAGGPEQSVVPNQERRPGPDRLAGGRALVYFGGIIQSVGKASLG